jgi:hypothetical protein
MGEDIPTFDTNQAIYLVSGNNIFEGITVTASKRRLMLQQHDMLAIGKPINTQTHRVKINRFNKKIAQKIQQNNLFECSPLRIISLFSAKIPCSRYYESKEISSFNFLAIAVLCQFSAQE